MTDDEISHMSISALKTVLFQNHVNARLLLEKSDLVARVYALLGGERQERARVDDKLDHVNRSLSL